MLWHQQVAGGQDEHQVVVKPVNRREWSDRYCARISHSLPMLTHLPSVHNLYICSAKGLDGEASCLTKR
jgi:hypothetical protein